MYVRCREKKVWKKFWEDEKANTPKFLNAGSQAWHTSWEDFEGFCEQCADIFLIDDVALVYVERIGDNANVHFSVLRGHGVEMDDLLNIRGELALEYKMVFGWCGSKNFGLKKILESCGLRYYGFKMLKGYCHGKPLEWDCYSLAFR